MNFLAVLTTHTVHICMVPDSSHLSAEDTGVLKPKCFTLGPTIHVTSRSPIVSALWHPLGVNSCCLVTITADAIVRVWEISLTDRWSFDTPTLSIDLKKLADGTSIDQDFAASTSATNTSFSPDSFEMQVASACFASRGSGEWSPMTLWVAMREGDIYALCPLLPQRWAPPPLLIPSLSVSIVTKLGAIEDDPMVPEQEKLLAQQQLQWMSEIDGQEPQIAETPPGEPLVQVYTRPSRPGTVPRLQGPFVLHADIESEDDLDTELTDIFAIGKKIDVDDLMIGEDEELDLDDSDQEGLELSVICVVSTSGQVRVHLDLDGVEAQWLPPKPKGRIGRLTLEPPSLLLFQCIDTMAGVEVTEEGWPMFSPDVLSRYSFYITHHAGITYISLAPWVFRLSSELQADSEAGSDFRIGLLANGQSSTRERVYSQRSGDIASALAASVAIRDPDIGHFLLSATPYEPIALTFETPQEYDLVPLKQETPLYEPEPVTMQPLDFYEPRPVFQLPHVFDEPSALPGLLDRLRTSRHRTIVTQEVRLSPVTLQVFTDAHKVLSDETFRLGVAASELFRKCENMQTELRQQISKANEVKGKVEEITGGDGGESDNAKFEKRISEAQLRQKLLLERLDALKKSIGKGGLREISAKERAFIDEVKSLEASMSASASARQGPSVRQPKPMPGKRYEEVRRLRDELVSEVDEAKKRIEANDSNTTNSDIRIPPEIRRARVDQVKALLARNTALVEAVSGRLERLNVG
jgi:nucleoporin NUP82